MIRQLSSSHHHRTGLALGDVEDDEAAIDGFLERVEEPFRSGGVARAEGFQHQGTEVRRLQHVADEVFRNAREELQDADIAVDFGVYLQLLEVLMFVSLPVTNQLTRWNESTTIFSSFEKLEDYLKMLEETAAATTEKMLNVDTIGGLLLNLLVIALIPAIGEELTFRGVLQQGLMRKMNPHVAIVISLVFL